MEIICGDDIGVVKKVNVQTGQIINKWNFPEKGVPIISVLSENQFIFGLAGTQIFVLDEKLNLITIQNQTLCTQQFLGVHLYQSQSDQDKQQIQLILTFINGTIGSLNFDIVQNKLSNETLIYSSNLRLNSTTLRNNKLLLLWIDKPPSILNLDEHQIVWKAKNLPNDCYDLQVIMNDKDGVFIDDYTIAVLTLKSEIRLYDITQDNVRPFQQFNVNQYCKCNSIKIIYDDTRKYFYVLTIQGEVLILDQRKNFQQVSKLKGSQGSLRGFYVDEEKKYIFTISLDRYLRVYDYTTNQIILKHNLQNRLQTIAFINNQNIELEEQMQETKVRWNVHTGKEARDRFKYMRKHTIKLKYLKQMFENQKILKKKKILKDQHEQLQQDIRNEEYLKRKLESDLIEQQQIQKPSTFKGYKKIQKNRNLTNKRPKN